LFDLLGVLPMLRCPLTKMVLQIGNVVNNGVRKVRELSRVQAPKEVLVHRKPPFIRHHLRRKLIQVTVDDSFERCIDALKSIKDLVIRDGQNLRYALWPRLARHPNLV
jgi:hypothetical protein